MVDGDGGRGDIALEREKNQENGDMVLRFRAGMLYSSSVPLISTKGVIRHCQCRRAH